MRVPTSMREFLDVAAGENGVGSTQSSLNKFSLFSLAYK